MARGWAWLAAAVVCTLAVNTVCATNAAASLVTVPLEVRFCAVRVETAGKYEWSLCVPPGCWCGCCLDSQSDYHGAAWSVVLQVGTPAVKFGLYVDTGSSDLSLTYAARRFVFNIHCVQCSRCLSLWPISPAKSAAQVAPRSAWLTTLKSRPRVRQSPATGACPTTVRVLLGLVCLRTLVLTPVSIASLRQRQGSVQHVRQQHMRRLSHLHHWQAEASHQLPAI